MLKLIWAIALLEACKPAPRMSSVTSHVTCAPAPDASPDAYVDPYASAWPRHTIALGASTGTRRGADGVDLALIGGELAVASAWEEGAAVTVSLQSGSEPWQTITIAQNKVGVEDAKFADLDGDGRLDVISASDSEGRIHVSFQPQDISAAWTTTTLSASLGHNYQMQIAPADVDGDGLLDIVGGSRNGSAANPATIAWYKNPGATVRTGADWTYHQIGIVGWTMSLLAKDVDGDGDVDVIVSDRSSYPTSSGAAWDLFGSRWLEQQASGAWVNHRVTTPVSNAGQPKFLWIGDWNGDGVDDVIDGLSDLSAIPNRIEIHRASGPWVSATFGTEVVPDVANVGHYQAVAVGDLDGDGRLDLAVSTTKANACCLTTSGVYWLRNTVSGWIREEVSGESGTKFDNLVLRDIDGDGDLDIVDSEQVEQLGVVWYENPRRS